VRGQFALLAAGAGAGEGVAVEAIDHRVESECFVPDIIF